MIKLIIYCLNIEICLLKMGIYIKYKQNIDLYLKQKFKKPIKVKRVKIF